MQQQNHMKDHNTKRMTLEQAKSAKTDWTRLDELGAASAMR